MTARHTAEYASPDASHTETRVAENRAAETRGTETRAARARSRSLFEIAWPWILWLSLFVLATGVMQAARLHLDNASAAFLYLLVVLGASVHGGRAVGIVMALVGFLSIDYYFQVPYEHWDVDKFGDWFVLVGFLATSIVATNLLARAQAEAERARQRAVEIARLSAAAQHAEALREADRLKDALLAGVSHDLRTPLTTIKALAQGIAARGDANAVIIEEQAERLARMVSDLLDLSRLKGGAFPVAPELNTAEDLIGAVVRQFAGVAGAQRIRVDIDYTRPALLGSFDFVQSVRILGNLVDNALRHGPPGTSVVIRVSAQPSWLVFTVEDEGPGIPTAQQERLFEPFSSAASQIPDAGRAGLGLSIAHRLAVAQGGELQYTQRPGGGSAFVVRLPGVTLAQNEPRHDLADA